MRIIVTDVGRYWNHESPILEKYAECVLVVCLNGKKVTDKFECFVSPYKQDEEGIEDRSVLSKKYQTLKSVKRELRQIYGYNEDILFLTDNEPQSLYPYLVLKDNQEYNKMHLWCMSPWKFDLYQRRKDYFELLHDIEKLQSLLYVDSNALLSKMDKDITLPDLTNFCVEYFSKLLPGVLYDIAENIRLGKHYYYDFGVNRYIQAENSYDAYLAAKPLDEKKVEEYHPNLSFLDLGLIIPNRYPNDDEDTKKTVRQPLPRIDGKQVCEKLKKMRKSLADANGIKYKGVDCSSTGPCAGTCPCCDREICRLQAALQKIPEEERVYPKFKIEAGSRDVPSKSVGLFKGERRIMGFMVCKGGKKNE